jgi:hypothetical protein
MEEEKVNDPVDEGSARLHRLLDLLRGLLSRDLRDEDDCKCRCPWIYGRSDWYRLEEFKQKMSCLHCKKVFCAICFPGHIGAVQSWEKRRKRFGFNGTPKQKKMMCGCTYDGAGLIFVCGKHEVRGGRLVCRKSGKPFGFAQR